MKVRINLLIAAILIVIFSTLGVVLFRTIKSDIVEETDQRMQDHVQDFYTILDDHVKLKQEQVNISLSLASEIIYSSGNIVETNSQIDVVGIDQISKNKQSYTIRQWKINDQPLYNNFEIVDHIKSHSVEAATIFQKIEDGYLRISTNVLNEDGSRAVNTYIPNSSEVVKAIERGETYYGRAFVVNDWYLTAYEPIRIDGVVKGMLFVGIKEKNYAMIKQIFSSKKYYNDGYPFLVSETGDFIIHPANEGQNFANANFFKQMVQAGSSDFKSEYKWPETDQGRQKTQYFKYFAPYKCYISTSIYNDDLYLRIQKMMNPLCI